MTRRDYVVGLGSNLGPRLRTLQAARRSMAGLPATDLMGSSCIYETDPVGPPQPRYLNAAVRLRSGLPPLGLLDRLLAIEDAMKRRRTVRWGPRTLDLDILWSSDALDGTRLTVPHPRLHERWWALEPLLEVAPELAGCYGPHLAALAPQPMPVGLSWAPDPQIPTPSVSVARLTHS